MGKRLVWPLLLGALILGACNQRKQIILEPARPKIGARASGIALHLAEVLDKREMKESIGDFRNGFGKVIGHIYPDRPAESMFEEELDYALSQAGFKVSRGRVGDGSAAVLEADILELKVYNTGATVEAKATLGLHLKRGKKKDFFKELPGYKLRMSMWMTTTKDFEKVMNEALDDLMDKVAELVTSKEFIAAAKGD